MKKNNNDAVVPFLWVRSEDSRIIEREIDAIKALSVNAFIIESRPKFLAESDFGTESWFARVGKIIAYARKLNMRVWLLDDRSFPTGSANGKIIEKYPQLKGKQLKCVAVDVTLKGEPSFVLTGVKKNSSDKIIYAAISIGNKTEKLCVNPYDTIAPIPALYGLYRVYFVIETECCPEREGYIDMLNPDSTEILIKEVYEPHYNRFEKYFGNTFAGFFSDEPRFCNGVNPYYSTYLSMYDYNCGKLNVAYPFSEGVLKAFKNKEYAESDLLALFVNRGKITSEIRVAYMDIITEEYSKNFVGKLSAWCNERNVLYAGHVIEDMGVHFTTGCGAGHYFKAMKNADFAGIDVVLHQIKPYYNAKNSISPIEGGVADGKFFNFTLAKLASSAAVLSKSANGKSLCEIFGAYGWGESLGNMLYLVNHMAVRGINHFIPHAFSMNLYDTDCPPYFFGQGKNPSYDGYKKLFEYMTFLSDFSHCSYARVAVFYNAESVWCGEEYLSIDEIAKTLTENQTEFDFIDMESLSAAELLNGKIKVKDCIFDTLIIPEGFISARTTEILQKIAAEKIIVKKSQLRLLPKNYNREYSLKNVCKNLRIKRINEHGFMLFNEGLSEIKNELYFNKKLFLIEPISKTCVGESSNNSLSFKLKSGQALFAFDFLEGFNYAEKLKSVKTVSDCDIWIKPFDSEEWFDKGRRNVNYSPCMDNPSFSGCVKYVFNHYTKTTEFLSVDYYGEFVKIEVNGFVENYILSPAKVRLNSGENIISVTVCNTLANAMQDSLSAYSEISACGVKSIKICIKE